nr:NAD(P)/FAD-dependent oxidoreductase [Heliobacterium chlorum]
MVTVSVRFDIIVVGSGAAGLATAIQLARYNHSVLVFDGGDGRTSWVPKYHNYLGFPQGISGKEMLRLGREQAQNYGAEIVKSQVLKAEKKDNEEFVVTTSSAEYTSRRLVLATGLEDNQPDISNKFDFAGRTLHYCLDCNGYEFIGQKSAVLGHSKKTIYNALELLNYTHQVCIVTNGQTLDGYDEFRDLLTENHIDVLTEPVERFVGKAGEKGRLQALRFTDGSVREVDVALSTYGVKANNQLAQSLNVECNDKGHVIVNEQMETSVPHVYAAGDIINKTQMLVFATCEGIRAAMSIHRSLVVKRQPSTS